MHFLHTMIRVNDLNAALHFFCDILGLIETRRKDVPAGEFTLVFLATHPGAPEIELTHNWNNTEPYSEGRHFGHLAFGVENIYETCQKILDAGITLNRPPRDGHMAFIRSPDNISIELIQQGGDLPASEPWISMKNIGTW